MLLSGKVWELLTLLPSRPGLNSRSADAGICKFNTNESTVPKLCERAWGVRTGMLYDFS